MVESRLFTFFSRLAQAYLWTKTKAFCQSCTPRFLGVGAMLCRGFFIYEVFLFFLRTYLVTLNTLKSLRALRAEIPKLFALGE